eukprot:gnl/Trimastix_PCT/4682.p1 GENE.gnl/Trimastix_PCT/4682~~gnl/Trimastix_PCT/4682.p1  ORF type:complete len:956 (+),score=292.92 gnl/Trimastix_PCT/4682:144-3011(+)
MTKQKGRNAQRSMRLCGAAYCGVPFDRQDSDTKIVNTASQARYPHNGEVSKAMLPPLCWVALGKVDLPNGAPNHHQDAFQALILGDASIEVAKECFARSDLANRDAALDALQEMSKNASGPASFYLACAERRAERQVPLKDHPLPTAQIQSRGMKMAQQFESHLGLCEERMEPESVPERDVGCLTQLLSQFKDDKNHIEARELQEQVDAACDSLAALPGVLGATTLGVEPFTAIVKNLAHILASFGPLRSMTGVHKLQADLEGVNTSLRNARDRLKQSNQDSGHEQLWEETREPSERALEIYHNIHATLVGLQQASLGGDLAKQRDATMRDVEQMMAPYLQFQQCLATALAALQAQIAREEGRITQLSENLVAKERHYAHLLRRHTDRMVMLEQAMKKHTREIEGCYAELGHEAAALLEMRLKYQTQHETLLHAKECLGPLRQKIQRTMAREQHGEQGVRLVKRVFEDVLTRAQDCMADRQAELDRELRCNDEKYREHGTQFFHDLCDQGNRRKTGIQLFANDIAKNKAELVAAGFKRQDGPILEAIHTYEDQIEKDTMDMNELKKKIANLNGTLLEDLSFSLNPFEFVAYALAPRGCAGLIGAGSSPNAPAPTVEPPWKRAPPSEATCSTQSLNGSRYKAAFRAASGHEERSWVPSYTPQGDLDCASNPPRLVRLERIPVRHAASGTESLLAKLQDARLISDSFTDEGFHYVVMPAAADCTNASTLHRYVEYWQHLADAFLVFSIPPSTVAWIAKGLLSSHVAMHDRDCAYCVSSRSVALGPNLKPHLMYLPSRAFESSCPASKRFVPPRDEQAPEELIIHMGVPEPEKAAKLSKLDARKCDAFRLGVLLLQIVLVREDPCPLARQIKIFKEKASDCDPQMFDFINKALTRDPARRPTCKRLLEHPFVQQSLEQESRAADAFCEITGKLIEHRVEVGGHHFDQLSWAAHLEAQE